MMDVEIDEIPIAPPRDPLRAGRALLLLVVYFAGQLGTGVLLGVVWAIVADVTGEKTMVPEVILGAALLGSLTGIWLVLLLARRWTAQPHGALVALDVGWSAGTRRQLLLAGVAGALLGLGAVSFAAWASLRLPVPRELLMVGAAEQSASAFALWAVFLIFVAPATEELLFRGLMLRGLMRSWGPFAGGLCVTGLFVVFHLPDTRGWVPALMCIAALGTATLAARTTMNALGPAIVVHASYNTVVVLSTALSAF
jgi:membrane protease YdiL (CAAX protease family)